jgi:hypothetical protein
MTIAILFLCFMSHLLCFGVIIAADAPHHWLSYLSVRTPVARGSFTLYIDLLTCHLHHKLSILEILSRIYLCIFISFLCLRV